MTSSLISSTKGTWFFPVPLHWTYDNFELVRQREAPAWTYDLAHPQANNTVIMQASSYGNAPFLRNLLQAQEISCEVLNRVDKDGYSALDFAQMVINSALDAQSQKIALKCQQILLENGADANGTSLNLDPLYHAAVHQRFDSANLFIHYGAQSKKAEGLFILNLRYERNQTSIRQWVFARRSPNSLIAEIPEDLYKAILNTIFYA